MDNIIRKYRKKKGLTQEQLAELLDISPRHLQRIENEDNKPSINVLKKLIEILDISAEDVFKFITK